MDNPVIGVHEPETLRVASQLVEEPDCLDSQGGWSSRLPGIRSRGMTSSADGLSRSAGSHVRTIIRHQYRG